LNIVFLDVWLSHKTRYQLTQAQSGLRLLPQFLGAFSQGQVPTYTGKVSLLALTTLYLFFRMQKYSLQLSLRVQECRPLTPQDAGMIWLSVRDGIFTHLP
jgi:hypothetical protein